MRGVLALFVLIGTASVAAAQPRLATVTGSVADDCEIPMDNARVLLVHADRQAAATSDPLLVVIAATTETDNQGKFRLDNVAPGRYLVLVRPAGFQEDAYLAGGYAPTWYPAAIRMTDATPIDVATGQDVPGIAVTLTMGAMYSISGSVVEPPRDSRQLILTQRDDHRRGEFEVFRGVLQPDGRFFIGGVPPGDYILRAVRPPPLAGIQANSGETSEVTPSTALSVPIRVLDGDVTGIVLSR